MIKKKDKLTSYLEKSPKAKLWIKKFGMKKTADFSKKYLIGLILSFALISFGLIKLLARFR
jgi:hypothetical protein